MYKLSDQKGMKATSWIITLLCSNILYKNQVYGFEWGHDCLLITFDKNGTLNDTKWDDAKVLNNRLLLHFYNIENKAMLHVPYIELKWLFKSIVGKSYRVFTETQVQNPYMFR